MEIFIYILLALINLPFALAKNNKARWVSWIAIGFQLGLIACTIINNSN